MILEEVPETNAKKKKTKKKNKLWRLTKIAMAQLGAAGSDPNREKPFWFLPARRGSASTCFNKRRFHFTDGPDRVRNHRAAKIIKPRKKQIKALVRGRQKPCGGGWSLSLITST